MEKKVSITGMYETTYSGDVFVGKLSTPTKIGLTDQTKVALLEYLTESDDFHKLVCDITGVERKQVKISPELEKLKEDYSHMRESYEHEKQLRNDLIRKWEEETAKRLNTERERDCAQRHHKFVMDELFQMLKEVDVPSVKSAIEALKAERANGKLMAEQCELLKKENETLAKRYSELEGKFDRLSKSYNNVCNETKKIEKNRDNLSDNYNRLAEDHQFLNKCVQNQAEAVRRLYEEKKQLTDKVEKLKGKLDRASKRYGELIKIISDKAIKSI